MEMIQLIFQSIWHYLGFVFLMMMVAQFLHTFTGKLWENYNITIENKVKLAVKYSKIEILCNEEVNKKVDKIK